MERKENKIMQAFETFRSELAEMTNAQKAVDLYQAFDRLYLDYQEGRISEGEAETRLSALRSAVRSNAEIHETLKVSQSSNSLRQQAMARNHKALAERMLAMPRGTWDRSHVEIVQQAISVLSQSDGEKVSLELQKRLSDSVWASNYELADSISAVESERDSITKMLESMVSHDSENGYATDETERTLANDVQKQVVDAAVKNAQVVAIRNQFEKAQKEAKNFELSAQYLANVEKEAAAQQQAIRLAGNTAEMRETIKRAVDAVHNASSELVNKEFAKLNQIQKALVQEVAKSKDEAIKRQADDVLRQIAGSYDGSNAAMLIHNAENLKVIAQALNATNLVGQLNDVAQVGKSAQSLASFKLDTPADNQDDKEKALLEARMMYETHRMKYEQEARYADHAADMLKAIDGNVSTPDYSARAKRPAANKSSEVVVPKRLEQASDALKLVRALAQNIASNDVALYAPYAGSEVSRNMDSALKLADKATPMPTAIPTIQNKRARRSNQLMSDIRQLAFMPSVRSEMGFNATRYQMIEQMAERPLFKRVKFDKNNKEAVDMLPALYQAAGVRMKQSGTPLRKSSGKLDLSTSNLEIIKIIESQFDSGMKVRSDVVSHVAADPAQAREREDNPLAHATAVASDWIANRHNMYRNATDTENRVKTGRMGTREIASSLRGEGMALPKSVQEKLSPYLGFDLSNIRIYTGPVAAMASEAMGAHAFTLGKSIFFGEKKFDFNSPEGLALLAHELTHTTHFNSGDSVNAKEQAAESVEARVLKAFGGGSKRDLALENNPATATTKTTSAPVARQSVGARPHFDVNEVFDRVSSGLIDKMMAEINMDRMREGHD